MRMYQQGKEHNFQAGRDTSPNSSTKGNRGYKRPRNTRDPIKHLSTCKNNSTVLPRVRCDCPVFDPAQKVSNGKLIFIEYSVL